jgi:hypothetical protein
MSAQPDEHVVAFEAFGLKIGVRADDPSVIARLQGIGPAGSRPCDPEDVECMFGITTTDIGRYNVRFDIREGVVLTERDMTAYIAGDADLDLAIAALDVHVQSYIALHAPDQIFIRAGVVGYRGYAILVAGGPISGKSTLVQALVDAGATAYSEDYAPLDESGRVRPYFRTVVAGAERAERANGQAPVDDAELEPLPLGAIVLTAYRRGAEWQPKSLSRGEAVLAVMSHAEPGSERPAETFRGITNALRGDVVALQSDRGEAAAVAPLLLADVERALSQASNSR